MISTDAQVSRLRGALDRQIEADKQFEEKVKAALNQSSPPPQLPPAASPPLSPSTIPQNLEDRYAKGWSDACGLIMPQVLELHRRPILTTEKAASDRWVKWLPIICFCCTLFGFLLGWYGGNASSTSAVRGNLLAAPAALSVDLGEALVRFGRWLRPQ